MGTTRVAYVYPNSRREMIAGWKAGTAPDTHLLGLNQLARFGIEAVVREPALDSRARLLPHRVRWHLREVTLPWELRDVDVVFTPLANVIPLAASVHGRPRVVVFNFGLNTILRRAGRLRRRALLASLRRAAGVVCLGPSQREELLALGDLDPARVHDAVHGVDHRFFTPTGRPRDRLVLAVGRDLARDYATLSAVAQEIDARFVFVVLARNLEGIDVPANVEVRERIPYAELHELYDRAGCAVVALRSATYPYGSEGSGVSALLEAQSMAAPVVATDRPIVREYLTDGDAGVIVPTEDATALRTAIAALLADPDRSTRLGRTGRQTVEERYTMDHMAADLAPLLRAAAA